MRPSTPALIHLGLTLSMSVGLTLTTPQNISAAEPEAAAWDVNKPNYSVAAIDAALDVDRGTWLSLDVSPDGKTIAFDLLGDIYTLPIAGGEARAISSGHAWDMQPRFSPDGSRIAFTSDRSGGDNIWTMDSNGDSPRQITHETFRLLNNPSWSPDGNYVAARKHFTTSRSLGTGEIWLYHIGGGSNQSGQQIVERPSEAFQKELGEPMFAPDGLSLYYSQNSTPGNTFIYRQDSNKEVFQIRRLKLADGQIDTVVGGPGGAVRPTPSPDGKTLAYVKRVRAKSRLFVMDLASGEETMIYDDLDQDMQEVWAIQGVYPNMDWTPDSREVVFWAKGQFWRVDVASQEVRNIPFHVAASRSTYPPPRFSVDVAPSQFQTRMVRFASRSPDGKTIVFESLGKLYLKRGDRAPTQLSSDSGDGFELSPVWAPNSKDIYFIRWSDTDLASIHRVSARGGKSHKLNREKGQFAELAVSSDGSTLLYRKRAGHELLNPDWDRQPGLYTLDLKSGDEQFVSKRGYNAHFGPDDRIYALERAESATGRGSITANTRLLSMTHSGHDVRELAEANLATEMQLSPDGEHIAFVDGYHIYLSPIKLAGKMIALGQNCRQQNR